MNKITVFSMISSLSVFARSLDNREEKCCAKKDLTDYQQRLFQLSVSLHMRIVKGKHMKILWHISSHGWGHAARQREVIRVYRQNHPGTLISVASDVPRWFWEGSRIDSLVPGSPSPAVVERNGGICTETTLHHFRQFAKNSSSFLRAEISRQQQIRPDLVVTDIEPLPVKAAEATGIPAFAIGNFTWDWVLKQMFPHMTDEADLVAAMYNHGTYLKLPMGPNHSPFHSTVDTPLLRGGPPGDPEKAAPLLPPGKCCLIALRDAPTGVSLALPEGVSAVSSLQEPAHKNCYNIPPSVLSAAGATFADLVEACDLVLAKPGYGIISQILAMGKKAILLTGRKFPEEKYLLSKLRMHSCIVQTKSASSFSLPETIKSLMGQDDPSPVPSEGANSIIREIDSDY
jgi:hypothetical protein